MAGDKKGEKGAASAAPAQDPKPKAKPDPVPEKEWCDYVVAKGRTIQCNRGEIRGGKRLCKGDMSSAAFEVFRANGALKKSPEAKK